MSKERGRKPHQLTLEEVTRKAKEVILRFDNHQPTVLVEGNRLSSALQVGDMAATHEERAVQMFSAGFAVAQRQEVGTLRQVFFISEGWMSQQLEVRPSQDPKRIEVLTISTRQLPGHTTQLVIYEMIRDEQGRLT